MTEEIREGDWVRFKSSGFTNEGRVTRVAPDEYGVEVDNNGAKVYVSVARDAKIAKTDPPPES